MQCRSAGLRSCFKCNFNRKREGFSKQNFVYLKSTKILQPPLTRLRKPLLTQKIFTQNAEKFTDLMLEAISIKGMMWKKQPDLNFNQYLTFHAIANFKPKKFSESLSVTEILAAAPWQLVLLKLFALREAGRFEEKVAYL